MKVNELIKPNENDKKGKEMSYPNMYKNNNYGKETKVRPETVTIRDTKTGKVYGRKTIVQKET